jgi:hypothetical protein
MQSDSPEQDPSFDVPKLQPEKAKDGELGGAQASEKASAMALEQGASLPTMQPSGGSDDPAGATPTSVQTDDEDDDSTVVQDFLAAALPPIADDVDLIEKEWVDKAKEIVDRTSHDPYLQNQEITKVKEDYLKKRYNKSIKLSGE